MTMRLNRLLRVGGPCLFLALLFLPQAARAGGLIETFRAICIDTFPSFEAMEANTAARGGWLKSEPGAITSRVPFVIPNAVKQGSTQRRHTSRLDDMGVDYAKGAVLNLPAAGCSIESRRLIDKAAIARLLNSFKSAVFLGDIKGTITGGPCRAWVVRLNGRRAVLTVTEPRFGGKATGVFVALVRLDETLIKQLIAPNNTRQDILPFRVIPE